MVQVLPGVPGFGTQLAQALGQAGTQLGAGYLQGRQSAREAKQAEGSFSVLNNPNSTPLQQIHAFTALPEQYKKHAEPLWRAMIEPKMKSAERMKEYEALGLTGGQQPLAGQQPTVDQQGMIPQQAGQQQQYGAQQPIPGQEQTPQQPTSKYANEIQSIDQEIARLTPRVGLKTRTDNPLIAGEGAKAEAQIQELNEKRKRLQVLEAEERKEQREVKSEERKYGTQIKLERSRYNTKKLEEIGEGLRSIDKQESTYKEMDELLKNPKEFPNQILASFFTSHGELSPTGYAALSPTAQKFVSLVTSNFNGAKELVGGRLTNFDIGLFLQTLPNLLQSQEGKTSVLNRLKKVANDSKNYYESIQSQYDKEGAIENLDFFQAERRALKGVQESRAKEDKKQPLSVEKSDLGKYEGKRARDEDGNIGFVHNGQVISEQEWNEVKKKQIINEKPISNDQQQGLVDQTEKPEESIDQDKELPAVQVVPDKKVLTPEQKEIEKIKEREKNVEQYQKVQQENKDLGKRILTNAAINSTSAVAGFPGDIASLAYDYGFNPIMETFTGIKGAPYKETPLSGMLPTSGQVKETLKGVLPEKATKELGPIEKAANETIETAAGYLAPGMWTRFFRSSMPFLSRILSRVPNAPPAQRVMGEMRQMESVSRALGVATGAQVAKEATVGMTGSETAGSLAHVATSLVLSPFLSQQNIRQGIARDYERAMALIPENHVSDMTPVIQEMGSLRTLISGAFPAQTGDTVLREIDRYMALIQDGTMSTRKLVQSRSNLNETLSRMIYDAPNDVKTRSKNLMTGIMDAVDGVLNNYGLQNPEWCRQYREANNAFATMAKTNQVSDFLQGAFSKYNTKTEGLTDYLTGTARNAGFGALMYGAMVSAGYHGTAGSTAIAGGLGMQAGIIAYRIAQSPTLRRHYGRFLSASLMRNQKLALDYASKIDEELHKIDMKKTYEILNDEA